MPLERALANVANILVDYAKKDSQIVASEICGTSISSAGDGAMTEPRDAEILDANPHIVFRNHKRGYVLCEATAKQMVSELRIVDMVSVPDGKVSKAGTFVVESDRKGIHQVA